MFAIYPPRHHIRASFPLIWFENFLASFSRVLICRLFIGCFRYSLWITNYAYFNQSKRNFAKIFPFPNIKMHLTTSFYFIFWCVRNPSFNKYQSVFYTVLNSIITFPAQFSWKVCVGEGNSKCSWTVSQPNCLVISSWISHVFHKPCKIFWPCLFSTTNMYLG